MGKSLFRWQFSIANCNSHYQEGKSHVYQRIIPPFIWYFPIFSHDYPNFIGEAGARRRLIEANVACSLCKSSRSQTWTIFEWHCRYLDNLSWFMLYLAICLCCRYPYHHIYLWFMGIEKVHIYILEFDMENG